MDKLVIKDVAEAGGYGCNVWTYNVKNSNRRFKTIISANPRRFIAQELIEFYDEECFINDEIVQEKLILEPMLLWQSDEPKVWQWIN